MGKILSISLISLCVLIATGWSMLFLYYSNLPGEILRIAISGAFGIGTAAAFVCLKNRKRTLAGFTAAFAALVAWFFLIPASNAREWQPEVAVSPTADIDGDKVTIRNVRNFAYRSADEFNPRYYDKELNLNDLHTVDLITVYWGSAAIAHVMISFGFAGKDYICFSIETRKERGEGYSTIKGFFRQFEVYYVVADERDVIRVRTNYREPNEDAYIYRTRMPIENQRKLFLDYLRSVNELAERPAWYNTLTDNCTTGILKHVHSYAARAKYNWKILLSGYSAQYAYDLGALDSSRSFEELRRLGRINDRARAADQAEDFSQRIREGVPSPKPMSLEEFNRSM